MEMVNSIIIPPHIHAKVARATDIGNINILTIQQLISWLHIIVFTDSSSSLGWMYKESFHPFKEEIHVTVSQWSVCILISNKVSLHYQHIKGSKNIIAESLSRYFHISHEYLTDILKSIIPSQTVASFHIKPFPIEIISWIFLPAESSTQPK